MKKEPLGMLVTLLLVIGGINWGLVGLIDLNLVTMLFGEMTVISKVVYSLVGLAGVYTLIGLLTKE